MNFRKKEGKSERRGKKQMFKMGYGVRVGGNGRRRLMYVDERRRGRRRERESKGLHIAISGG